MTKLYKKSEITFTISVDRSICGAEQPGRQCFLRTRGCQIDYSSSPCCYGVDPLLLDREKRTDEKIWSLQIICAGKELFVLHPIGSNSIGIPVDRHRASFHNPGDDMLRCQHVLRRVH